MGILERLEIDIKLYLCFELLVLELLGVQLFLQCFQELENIIEEESGVCLTACLLFWSRSDFLVWHFLDEDVVLHGLGWLLAYLCGAVVFGLQTQVD